LRRMTMRALGQLMRWAPNEIRRRFQLNISEEFDPDAADMTQRSEGSCFRRDVGALVKHGYSIAIFCLMCLVDGIWAKVSRVRCAHARWLVSRDCMEFRVARQL